MREQAAIRDSRIEEVMPPSEGFLCLFTAAGAFPQQPTRHSLVSGQEAPPC